jgi:hypothetical protein
LRNCFGTYGTVSELNDSILPRENLKNEVREALVRKTELTTKVHNDLVTTKPN